MIRAGFLFIKDLLLREKAGLLESEENFGQRRKNWIEPLRSYVLSLQEAADLEKTSDYVEWKKFFQKIGSNPILKDKTVSMRWGDLYDFTAAARARRHSDAAHIAKQYAFDMTDLQNVTSGALIMRFARTFFEKSTDCKNETAGVRAGSRSDAPLHLTTVPVVRPHLRRVCSPAAARHPHRAFP